MQAQMICQFKTADSQCTIATGLAALPVVISDANVCQACSKCDAPHAVNRVTCDIAVLALHRQGKPLTPPLVKYVRSRKLELLHNISSFNRPGLALRKLLLGLVEDRAHCGCDEYAALMDSWGTEGCIARRGEIIAHLNTQSVSFWEMIKIATATGCLTTGQLVDKAIEDSR